MAAHVAPDRLRVSHTRLWAMAALTAAMVWAALGSLPTTADGSRSGMITQASVLVAVLAVFGLRSVPVRRIIRAMALLTGVLIARFGQLSATEGLAGSWKVLLWLGSVAVALVLAPSSRSVMVDVEPADAAPAARATRHATAIEIDPGTRGRIPLAIAAAAVSLVLGTALLLGPRVSGWFPAGTTAGDLVDRRGDRSDNVLSARDSLDMTSRPRLSDRIVMTVRSPIVSFWRAEVFDTWDGSTWTRSYGRAGNMLIGGRATPSPDDIAASKGVESTQEFRLEAGFATVLPAAPSPVQVDSSIDVGQRVDGTLITPYRAVGRGTTYTVTSRQMPIDGNVLRGEKRAIDAARDDPVAAAVIAQYAGQPVITDRVAEIAVRVTEGSASDFERILALEKWMGDNTTYSLDAPLSPKGVDVVDHFLFDSREGWCEQIASSLVVMARSVGVPARLATGYAPGEWDSTGRRFVVREREAHAWAEVWFPDSGWVPFDPTASVPFAGTDEASAGAAARDWREILGAMLLVVGIVSVAYGPVVAAVTRLFARMRERRAERREAAERWEVRAERTLERIGRDVERPRRPADTLTSYGSTVAERLDDPRVAEVGSTLDRLVYARLVYAEDDLDDDRARLGAVGDDAARDDSAHRDAMDDARARVEAILESVVDSLEQVAERSPGG